MLTELRSDPRLTMAELGRRIGMSSPAVTERVRRLEDAGVIVGYRLDIEPAALGLPIAAYVRVRPNPGQLPSVAEIARAVPEVVECHRVTGEDCFVARAHLRSIEDLERLIDQIIPHAMTTTSIIQSTLVKRRSPAIAASADGLKRPAAGAGSQAS